MPLDYSVTGFGGWGQCPKVSLARSPNGSFLKKFPTLSIIFFL